MDKKPKKSDIFYREPRHREQNEVTCSDPGCSNTWNYHEAFAPRQVNFGKDKELP